MGKLIYSALMSLDGYIEDEAGGFDWAAPDDEVHGFVNEQERAVGTYLFGRRMYETMAVWETEPALAEGSPVTAEYARIWQAAEKVVFSRTLAEGWTARTRIEPEFEPEAVRRLVSEAERNVSIGGAELAREAFRAGLVDEVSLYLAPVIVGGGKAALPRGVFARLELVEERRFGGGVVWVRYGVSA
jgi:dihydrofolate reductase